MIEKMAMIIVVPNITEIAIANQSPRRVYTVCPSVVKVFPKITRRVLMPLLAVTNLVAYPATLLVVRYETCP